MKTKAEATIEDLYRVPENGKAELVNGEMNFTIRFLSISRQMTEITGVRL